MLAVAEWPRRQLVKASCLGFDPPTALTGVVIASPQLFWLEIARGAELPGPRRGRLRRAGRTGPRIEARVPLSEHETSASLSSGLA
jgi:hypothetical protein